MKKYKDFDVWLRYNGAKFPAVEYPEVFGKNLELISLCAKLDI
jgi:hypothetical protein